jgi:hypothetical protein
VALVRAFGRGEHDVNVHHMDYEPKRNVQRPYDGDIVDSVMLCACVLEGSKYSKLPKRLTPAVPCTVERHAGRSEWRAGATGTLIAR